MKKIGLGAAFLFLVLAVIWAAREKVKLDEKLQNAEQAAPVAEVEAMSASETAGDAATETAMPATDPGVVDDTITFDQLNQCLAKRLEQAPACAQTVAADLLNFVAENLNNYKFQTSPDIDAERQRSITRIVKECKMAPEEAARLLALDLTGC